MASLIEALSLNNPVFQTYIFWSTVLVLKMMFMSVLTAMQRFKTKTFANPEDTKTFKNLKPKFGDENVERVRRAHRNDLENIPAFITIGLFYVLTSPSAFLATNIIRACAVSRIVHTISYAIFSTQPARGLSWMICYASTIYMGVQVLFFFRG